MTTLRATIAVLLYCLALGAHAQDSTLARAHAYLLELARTNQAPGIAAAVAVNGHIIFSEGTGFADVENSVPANGASVFNIGSVSKLITAVAVMQLIERGQVALDDPIHKYVPAFTDKAECGITVREVLTHTSGIRHYGPHDFPGSPDNENIRPYPHWEEGISIFNSDPLLFPPGHGFAYSSYAVNLLQGVVETASGLPFEAYMQRKVWQPAEMRSTSFDVPERIVPHRARSYRIANGHLANYYYNDLTYKFASGGMISSAEDLVRLGMALNHGKLLNRDTLALMYHRHVDPVMAFRANGVPEPEDFAQGLLWRIYDDDHNRLLVGECGTVKGFNACIMNFPELDVVAAIVANSYDSPARRATINFARMFADTDAAK